LEERVFALRQLDDGQRSRLRRYKAEKWALTPEAEVGPILADQGVRYVVVR